MVQLTELQGKVVAYILQCLDKTGMPPTLREIAAHFEWKAVGSAQDVVTVLRKKVFASACSRKIAAARANTRSF